MGLTSAQRVSITAKLASIPVQNAQTASSQASLSASLTQAQAQDDANKTLMDAKTALINPYQTEKENLDGNGHTQLSEQNLLDAANRIQGNFFFPNQPSVPLPDCPTGAWTFFVPFYYSVAQGKTGLEAYTAVTNETALLATITTSVATLLAQTLVTRVTGEACTDVPADPSHVPPILASTTIANDPTTQAAMTSLVAAVTSMQTCLNAELAALSSLATLDTDATRAPQNAAAISSINSALAAVSSWLSVPTFNPTSGTYTDCSAFNSMSVTSLLPTKADSTNLPAIQGAMSTRSAFVATRVAQLSTNLGAVTQTTTDGSIASATGFYGDRAKVIGLRLNAIGGSLSQVQSLKSSGNALSQQTAANQSASDVYSSQVAFTSFAAPANGTAYVNVANGSLFSPGDLAYVASATQPEMQVYVKSVNANQVLLDRPVPPTYLQSDQARLYKEI